MISNQILQNTIDGLKGISGVDFIVLDTDGNEVAETTKEDFDYDSEVVEFVKSPADSQEFSKYLLHFGKDLYIIHFINRNEGVSSFW